MICGSAVQVPSQITKDVFTVSRFCPSLRSRVCSLILVLSCIRRPDVSPNDLLDDLGVLADQVPLATRTQQA